MRLIIVTLLTLFAFSSLHAQSRYYLRADGGFNRAKVYSDSEFLSPRFRTFFRRFSGLDSFFGLYAGRKLFGNYGLELGVNYQGFNNRHVVIHDEGAFSSSFSRDGRNAFIVVPLNLYYSFDFEQGEHKIAPRVGISYATHLRRDHHRTDITFDNITGGDNLSISNGIDTSTTFTTSPAHSFGILVNAGISIEYGLGKRFAFTFNGNYSFGFREINRFVVLMKKGSGENREGSLRYDGTHYYLACGVKMVI